MIAPSNNEAPTTITRQSLLTTRRNPYLCSSQIQTSALRSTTEELYSTQNQLAVVQTSITAPSPAVALLESSTIEALKQQLTELGEIKRMRDQEANRIILELEQDVEEKERELKGERGERDGGETSAMLLTRAASPRLSEFKQSSLTEEEREGWEVRTLTEFKG